MDSGPGSCVVDGHENDNEIQETKKLIMEENGEIYMVNGRGLYITITALNEQWCSKIFITTRWLDIYLSMSTETYIQGHFLYLPTLVFPTAPVFYCIMQHYLQHGRVLVLDVVLCPRNELMYTHPLASDPVCNETILLANRKILLLLIHVFESAGVLIQNRWSGTITFWEKKKTAWHCIL